MARTTPRPDSFRMRAHGPDYGLLAIVAALGIIGLITVYSSSYALGYAQFQDANYFVKRQAVFLVIGFGVLIIAMMTDYRLLMRTSPLLMLMALIGLTAVLIPGIGMTQNGAHRWIALGPLPALQPSEFAKLAVLIYMAAWLTAKGDQVQDVSLGVMPFVTMVGLIGALIMLEPDMGTAVIVSAITGTLFFVSGAKWTHLGAVVGSGLLLGAILIMSSGYRASRILSFTSAEDHADGVGFHTLQLIVAFGSGGIFGRGLGVSRQKFFYIPGSHTDGALAIIGEELGFIGVMLVLALFTYLLWRGLKIVQSAPDQFGSLLAMGALSWIAFQFVINVGGVTRAIPLTGIPLPFLSYGGSALIATLAAMGVLLSVSRYSAIVDPEREAPTRGVLRSIGLGSTGAMGRAQ